MKKPVVKLVAASVLAGTCSMAVLAQDPNLGNMSAAAQAKAPSDEASGPAGLRGSGRLRSGTWFSAVKFTGRLSSTAPQLTYASNHYYNAPGAASPQGYFAQLDLEPGVAVDLVTCVFNDPSAANNFSASLQKFSANITTGPTTGGFLASNATTGSNGFDFFFLQPAAPETISTYTPGFTLHQYHIRADVANDTSFAGCWAWWTRQMSPAPGVASFLDVPTNHFAFQAIEALKASQVTTGCTANTYCPNNNITRAEMALFMSRALGLNWPW